MHEINFPVIRLGDKVNTSTQTVDVEGGAVIMALWDGVFCECLLGYNIIIYETMIQRIDLITHLLE